MNMGIFKNVHWRHDILYTPQNEHFMTVPMVFKCLVNAFTIS